MEWDNVKIELGKLPGWIRRRVGGYVSEAHERGDDPREDLGVSSWKQVINYLAYYERTGKIPPGAEELIRDYRAHVRTARDQGHQVGVRYEDEAPAKDSLGAFA